MGKSFYCLSQKGNKESFAKLDLIIKNNDINEKYNRDSTTLIISNNRSSIDSPVYEPNNIFINPIPELVKIRQKKRIKKMINN